MWYCVRCGQCNEGNICQSCGLPAYQGDPDFARHRAERMRAQNGAPVQQGAQVSQSAQLRAPKKPRRKRRVGSFLFCLLALLLCALAAYQSVQTNYRFSFHVDTDNMSQSLLGVTSFVSLDLESELSKLNRSGEYSILTLYDPQSDLYQARDAVTKLSGTAETALQYMKNFGLVGEDTSLNTARLTGLFDRMDSLLPLFKLLGGALGICLLLALVLLLLGRHGGARTLVTLVALSLGALPIVACALLNSSLVRAMSDLVTMQNLGIGFTASLALTSSGMLQIVFCAAALVCVVLSCAANALTGGRH